MDSRWLDGSVSSPKMQSLLVITWVICIPGIETVLQKGYFEGLGSFPLVTCNISETADLVSLSLRDETADVDLASLSPNSRECSTGPFFAACDLSPRGSGGPLVLTAVLTGLQEGEVHGIECQAVYQGASSSLRNSWTVAVSRSAEGPSTSPESKMTENGTKPWIQSGPWRGMDHIRVVECTRPKEEVFSLSLSYNGSSRTIGNVNILGKSCTMTSVLTSCLFGSEESDVSLRVLLTGEEGDTHTLWCRAGQEQGYVAVTVGEAPQQASSGMGSTWTCGAHQLLVTISCVVVMLTASRQLQRY